MASSYQKQVYCVICLFLFPCLTIVSSNSYSSIWGLNRVVKAEKQLSLELKSYIVREEVRLAKLKKITEDYDAHIEEILLQDTEAYLGNPLNAFLLMKRFTTDWNRVENLIKNNTSDDFLSGISGSLSAFPEDEDLAGAGRALLRLQDTYNLPTSSMSRGQIKGVKLQSKIFTAADCFKLGQIAYDSKDFYHTLLWMNETLLILGNETEPTVELQLVHDYLSFAAYEQGNTVLALNSTLAWLAIEPDNHRALYNRDFYLTTLDENKKSGKVDDDRRPGEIKNERIRKGFHKSAEFEIYEALCRGEEAVEIPDKHKLKCRLISHHPFFMYSPLREEQMHFNPGIWVYHQLITDKEIAKMKELALPKLHISGTFSNMDGSESENEFRTSKTAWLFDTMDPIVKRLSLKTAAMANLTIESAESFQVLSYGMGGHYEPHWDFARDVEISDLDLEGAGNRIATAIYYLSDVEAGGATVFNKLGVRAVPEKGALTLWYNLHRNGKGDYRTQHAGCPVLSGFKWATNKWFHERGQEFIRPCLKDCEE